MAAVLRKRLCCCCPPKDGESDTDFDTESSASAASFESIESVINDPLPTLTATETSAVSNPQPLMCQEWDSLFFTPDMLAPALEPPTQVTDADASKQPLVSLHAVPEPPRTQLSMIAGMESLKMTNSLNAYAANLPGPEPPASTPLLRNFLSNVSMSDVRRAMRAEPFWYCKYLKKCRKCHDIKKYRWTTGTGHAGLVRGVRFLLPLPQDLPSWLQKSIQVPAETNGTTVVRLDGAGRVPDCEDDLQGISDSQPVVLVLQMCSHDAPYGEHFRVQETVRFTRAAGGVDMQRWVEVVWVKSLPWALGALRRIIETKTVAGAEEADAEVVEIIQKVINSVSQG